MGGIEKQAPRTREVGGDFEFIALGLLRLRVAHDRRQQTLVANVAPTGTQIADDGRVEDRVETADQTAGRVHRGEILAGREPAEAHRNAAAERIEPDAGIDAPRGRRWQERAVEALHEEVRVKGRRHVAVNAEPIGHVDRTAEGERVGSNAEAGRVVIVPEAIPGVLRLGEDVARRDACGGRHRETGPIVGGLRGARDDACGVFRNVGERGPILRRGGLEDNVAAVPTGSVVAREQRVFRFETRDVAPHRADDHQPVLKEAEVGGGHHVFELGDVISAIIPARGVEDVAWGH